MSTETNKAVVRRWVEEVINKNNVEVLNETHAASHVNHFLPPGAPQGIEGEKMLTAMFDASFSNDLVNIEDLAAEGDKVAVRFTYSGTHTGPFNNIPATGKTIAVGGIFLLRFTDGKIVENWVQFDMMSLLQQLGAIPAPA